MRRRLAAAILPAYGHKSTAEGGLMIKRMAIAKGPEPDIELERRREEEMLVHDWRAEQLRRLGLAPALAEGLAGLVDWHDFARLVEGGCPPQLATDILV
jgi:hypothetical protein